MKTHLDNFLPNLFLVPAGGGGSNPLDPILFPFLTPRGKANLKKHINKKNKKVPLPHCFQDKGGGVFVLKERNTGLYHFLFSGFWNLGCFNLAT